MQTTFFATDADLLEIARWFLEMPGAVLFEPASRPDLPNRWFCTVQEVENHFLEQGRSIAAWLESTGARPIARHIQFEPNTQRRLNASCRTDLVSPSVIAIRRNSDQNGCLAAVYLTCWNEKGARQRSMYSSDILDQVNWKALRSVEGGLKRKLSKASPAKLGSSPIMSDAFEKMKKGRLSLWNWGAACSYPSPHITVT
jgi:hypothetical protein